MDVSLTPEPQKSTFASHYTCCPIRELNVKKIEFSTIALAKFLSRCFSAQGCASWFHSNLPRDVCHLIARFVVESTVEEMFTWERRGPSVKVSEDKLTAVLAPPKNMSSSGSALANRSFSSGKIRWCVHVNVGHQRGCRYIGVVDSSTIDLSLNLQSGGSGHRVAWDGSCSSVYFDIVGYKNFPSSVWTTGDSVQVEMDCNKKRIKFFLNNQKVNTIDVSGVAGKPQWIPVIGFGSAEGQSVTLCSFCEMKRKIKNID